MDKAKRKELEAKLDQLFAQAGQAKKGKLPEKSKFGGAKVIRRRKGSADVPVS